MKVIIMKNNIYELHKRIMKNDPKAIDEIETLEEAKKILKMIMSNNILMNLNNNADEI